MAKIADVQEVSLEKLRPYERNAKKHGPRQIEKLKASMDEFGFLTPCLIDSEYNLIAGHGRVMAAKELGIETVPCVFIEGLTDEQRRAYILADNRLGELGEWDMELVLDELTELDDLGFDIELTGFEMPEELPEVIEDDFDESAIPDEPRTKLGDLYQLGRHRLICGDSTDPAVIDRLMDGVKAKLLLTDPPYGVKAVESGGHNDGKKAGKQICRDNVYMPVIGDDTTDTARANYDVALTCTENQIIFGGNYFTDFLPPSRCWIVWDKKVAGSFADGELAWTSFDRNLKIYYFMWSGMRRQGDRTVEGKTRVHPTQKPVGMLADILKDFSEENDSILDCFGGSGSTLIACEQLNRKCYMCELDPHYCDVIISRWETLTGREAVLING